MANIWLIDNFTGGLSDQDDVGIRGSFDYGEQLDFRSNPSVLTGQDKPSKNTTTIIEALPKWMTLLGSDVFVYDEDGKIYKKGTPWTKVHTNTETGVGNGFASMDGNLYYASNAKLGKDDGTFAAPADAAQTFKDGATGAWHPMKVFGGAGGLCVGDGRYIAVLDYDGVTFDDEALTLPVDVRVKSLEVWNDYLVIGTYKGTNVYDDNEAQLFFWDGTSSTYNYSLSLNESGIHALLASPSGLMIQAGIRGSVYIYNGGVPMLVKRIPSLARDGVTYNEIYPGAVTNFKGIPLIGVAGDGDDTTSVKAVYSWGTDNKNYPHVMNRDFLISTGTKTGATCQIGLVKALNDTNLYIGWRDNATYGVDLVNTGNKVASAIYRSLWFDANIGFTEKDFKAFFITMGDDMAANETITLKYRKDTETAFTTIGAVSSAGTNFYEFNYGIKARSIQLQLELAGTNNTLPTIKSIGAIYDVKSLD